MLLRIGLPSGIGDVLWAMTKFQAILDYERSLGNQYDGIHAITCFTGQQHKQYFRAHQFLWLFPHLVKDVSAVCKSIHPDRGVILERDGYVYLASGRVNDPDMEYLLIPNHDLERGIRLGYPKGEHKVKRDCYLPEFWCDFDIMDRCHFTNHREVHQDYFAVYLSQRIFYEGAGGFNYWNLRWPEHWTIEDWQTTIRRLIDKYNIHCVIVGAEYDDAVGDVLQGLEDLPIINRCGETSMQDAIAMLANAKFMLGYASGIPIISTYLKTPTVMFYNKNPLWVHGVQFHKDFPTSWIPPGAEDYYAVLRFGQARPADALAAVERLEPSFIQKNDSRPQILLM